MTEKSPPAVNTPGWHKAMSQSSITGMIEEYYCDDIQAAIPAYL